jgi:hypothetical protein
MSPELKKTVRLNRYALLKTGKALKGFEGIEEGVK